MTDPVVVGVLHALPHAVRSRVDFLAWKRVSVGHEATAMLVEVGSVAAVLVDTGLRREECFRLRWESITWLREFSLDFPRRLGGAVSHPA